MTALEPTVASTVSCETSTENVPANAHDEVLWLPLGAFCTTALAELLAAGTRLVRFGLSGNLRAPNWVKSDPRAACNGLKKGAHRLPLSVAGSLWLPTPAKLLSTSGIADQRGGDAHAVSAGTGGTGAGGTRSADAARHCRHDRLVQTNRDHGAAAVVTKRPGARGQGLRQDHLGRTSRGYDRRRCSQRHDRRLRCRPARSWTGRP